jgi:redox-sensitive bicupin YhaK (pirin superfamily)
MIKLRKTVEIFQTYGPIDNGTFHGRWHFSFDVYYDSAFVQFGTLRVFNDDTLSAGAVWPLHRHQEIEVVTYCVQGEFRHADQDGDGGVLQKGWVQHTTVGKGMLHSEINNRDDQPMRFIQMWFIPAESGLEPAVQQKRVERDERTNQLLLLVSSDAPQELPLHAEAQVYSSFLQPGHTLRFAPRDGWGVYLYLLEDGPVYLNEQRVETLGAAVVTDVHDLEVSAESDAELLLVHVALT